MNNAKSNLGQLYTDHEVFCKLDKAIEFYKMISFSVFGFLTKGTTSVSNIDSYFYSSVQGTLESIKVTLENGRINDSYTLLRKYHDASIINIYSSLYLEDHFNLDDFIVKKINSWIHGKDKLPEYRIMSQYIRNSKKLTELNNLLFKDSRYRETRDRCNDHTHYNFYKNVLINDNEISFVDRVKSLNEFVLDFEQILILHLSYIFYLNSHYMMSSDYVDFLEMGMTPEENSQYQVAPFIQEIFDHFIKNSRPDIAKLIKLHTQMELK